MILHSQLHAWTLDDQGISSNRVLEAPPQFIDGPLLRALGALAVSNDVVIAQYERGYIHAFNREGQLVDAPHLPWAKFRRVGGGVGGIDYAGEGGVILPELNTLLPRPSRLDPGPGLEMLWTGPGGPYPAARDPRAHATFAPLIRGSLLLGYWHEGTQRRGVAWFDLKSSPRVQAHMVFDDKNDWLEGGCLTADRALGLSWKGELWVCPLPSG
jgi:hypothetical protein